MRTYLIRLLASTLNIHLSLGLACFLWHAFANLGVVFCSVFFHLLALDVPPAALCDEKRACQFCVRVQYGGLFLSAFWCSLAHIFFGLERVKWVWALVRWAQYPDWTWTGSWGSGFLVRFDSLSLSLSLPLLTLFASEFCLNFVLSSVWVFKPSWLGRKWIWCCCWCWAVTYRVSVWVTREVFSLFLLFFPSLFLESVRIYWLFGVLWWDRIWMQRNLINSNKNGVGEFVPYPPWVFFVFCCFCSCLLFSVSLVHCVFFLVIYFPHLVPVLKWSDNGWRFSESRISSHFSVFFSCFQFFLM